MAKYNVSKAEAKKTGVKRVKVNDKKSSSKSSSGSKFSSKTSADFIQALKDNGGYDAYKNLASDQQEFLKFNYVTAKSDSKENIKLLSDALAEATKQADPYWRSFLTVAQDELARSFDAARNTYQYQKAELETKIKNLGEDLARNRDFYSLEQQADLAKLKMSYEQQRDQVVEEAASKGLTFSTKREVPLQQLEDYNRNVVESTNRNYEKKIADMTIQTQQAQEEANREIAQRAKDLETNLTSLGRSAEQKLGSDNLPSLSDYSPLGNISGQFYEDKVADIARRQQAIFNEKAMTSLKF